MIQAQVFENQKRITGFKITGHADYSEYGSDIVCSAISVLAINTVNSAEKLTGVKLIVDSDNANGGYLNVTVPRTIDSKQDEQLQVLLKSLRLGLVDVSQSYGKYIKIK
ncbi:ribosomal-processing cysteine protease Prp [Pediococcus claussenii]|uniref:Ribosomal processing cysteine protease Prp n=1 Tax=Pediococcus claussenii (strain ATCC BAA-344 / DSM 14800 / JCM 18046 / KCTC 3811 / LMG 21948 / P06) TaxID=701521 RepID=G8PDK1_PEDCP|nr:ribosomal-processing cysteine protease Prp [Pediococcus claussenii]AEV95336.1 hypothetical protein PECL_1068 [Pediococcus claussenii ATCC BAA-344]ANZ68868.1 hypothetical protein AYR57_00385 [Pediococcus claussenii]ANZ70684.1 hypothetical protein AYR58_00385 [Pediococcus claussenii]KRN19482.1 hypothetical protein IV79_GL001199 [Pediococcus claussenii]